ncbi:MAG: hypothetical protein EPO02_12975 [Nitrospirae bacterium]|nr:MAG: hypothetical protein EPO02_12975 [Nitrospirota bacterium]
MDKELKTKLDEAIKLAMTQWFKERDAGKFAPVERKAPPNRPAIVPKPVLAGTESVLPSTGNVLASTGHRAAQRFVTLVRNRLRRGPFWKKIHRELIAEVILHTLHQELAAQNKRKIEPAQMTLPGFSHVPKRIGGFGIAEVTLSTFFSYRDKYSKRANREKARVEELDKIADRVVAIYAKEPEVKLSEALDRTQPEPEPTQEPKPFLLSKSAKA